TDGLTQHISTPVSRYVLQDSNHSHLRLDKRWNQKWKNNKNGISGGWTTTMSFIDCYGVEKRL
ncbi:hypothetical protein BCR33DRAFT_719227, partial [Rhizoclosmatium globosum]